MNKLNMQCPIGFTGYGITSYSIYERLTKKEDLEISLFTMGPVSLDTEEGSQRLLQDVSRQLSFDRRAPFLKIWHPHELIQRIGSGKYGALIFFEVDKLKPVEINGVNALDTVFVASKWAKQILLDNGISTDIQVSPLGVNQNIFNTTINHEAKEQENSNYIFLNIGKWEIRKGHDFLIEAFSQAFTANDNVELWMISDNPFLTPEQTLAWKNLYRQSPLGNKIKIIDRVPTSLDLAAKISQSDCGVFPSRGEGWNNEILEVMAMNKPVIATNYSAHTEYLTPDNSYLVEVDNLTEAKDDKFFDGFGKWAHLEDRQYEQMIEHMRYVYKNGIKTNPIGVETSKRFSWTNTADIIYNNLYH